MLTSTFIHIPGIGSATEQKLWASQILDWEDEIHLPRMKLTEAKQNSIKTFLQESRYHLQKTDPGFFEARLPAKQHFRFFPEFRNTCAYLDIETTGLDSSAQITTIAIYNGQQIKYFIQGENLQYFPDELKKYSVLITYNGRSFDIPFIEDYFNITLPHSQIDLRYVLAGLGFKGGLKRCEKSLGIDRKELNGVDGYFAVLLWQEYRRSKNFRALETLLAYNIEDVINLETLMIKAYNLNVEKTVFAGLLNIKTADRPANLFAPDHKTIQKLKQGY